MTRRQRGHQAGDRTMHGPRHQALVKPRQPQCTERRIAGEEFVRPVAAQRHRHAGTRVAAQQVSGQQRAIRHGLVQTGTDRGRELPRQVDGEYVRMVHRAEMLRHGCRMSGFIEARFLEADAERVHPPAAQQASGARGHGRGIDAAAQEHAHRHVGNQPAPHRLAEQVAQFFAPARFRIGRHGRLGFQRKAPVLPAAQISIDERERKRIPGGQLEDILVERERRRNVAVGEVLADRAGARRGPHRRVREQRRQLRGKHQRAALDSIEKRLLAEAVAAAEQQAAVAVVDDKRPHAVQPFGQRRRSRR